jgi:hypothetical protein
VPVKFRGTFVHLDNEAMKIALDEVWAAAGVEVFLNAPLIAA